jgi:Histidine kinase-, DNA gyrase B-, and HSP90-like ATPase
MAKSTSILQVQFNPAPAYIFGYLTADVQSAACIFDLIDNSIDAARAVMSPKKGKGLPANYKGFEIKLILSADIVRIEDNCSGISESSFADTVFRSGMKSAHEYGIGHFGVGLKRAILKLGNRCVIETDDGKSTLKLEFTRDQLENAVDFQLPATKSPSSGSTYTTIEVTNIPDDIKRDLVATRWKDALIDNIGRRYGLFIKKGLVITVGGAKVTPFSPQPVQNKYIALQHEKFVSHGVEVEILAGVHERYRFGKTAKGNIGADPNNLIVHREIAPEFGWYVVCNDRVIVLHDQTAKTGWTTNWHNEYGGFVGWVHFRSQDPSLLPWDTRKTDIIDNHEVYADIVGRLQNMAQKYRQTTPLATQRRKGAPSAITSSSKQSAAPTAKSVLAGKATKAQLSSIPTLLPSNAAFVSNQPKLAGLVAEAERIRIDDYPYACAMLLRAVFDAGCRDFLARHGQFGTMRDAILDASLKPGQVPSSKERKNFSPSLTELVKWCVANSDVFPDPTTRACKISCEKFLSHLPTLNGITHETAGISNAGQIRNMRDSVLQGLLHMIGT